MFLYCRNINWAGCSSPDISTELLTSVFKPPHLTDTIEITMASNRGHVQWLYVQTDSSTTYEIS